MDLFKVFSELPDPRRTQGKRTSLCNVLIMSVLGYMCGFTGYRGIGLFAKKYSDALTELLALKHPVPSYVTFHTVLKQLDKNQLISAFNKWAGPVASVKKKDWINADGKALRSTVKNCHGKNQDFEAVVSFFCQKSGIIHSLASYKNKSKESGEIDLVRFLVEELKIKGAVITFDALSTQKKRSAQLKAAETIMWGR